MAANSQTKQNDLACEPASRLLAATIHTYHRHLLVLLTPKADTHFTVPRRVEG